MEYSLSSFNYEDLELLPELGDNYKCIITEGFYDDNIIH